MSHTQRSVDGAIARSISHDEIVTLRIGSEESIQETYEALCADPLCDDEDHVDATATLREVWGTTPDGEEWRVHIRQDERAGASRYSGDTE